MEPTGKDGAANQAQHQSLAARLSKLKEEGSALLVVGSLPPEQYRHACHRMLGDDTASTRRRILVTTTNATVPPVKRLPPTDSQPQADTVTHITYGTQSRSATAEAATATIRPPTEHVDELNLSTLGVTISEAIEDFQRIVPDLAPAELRVCFDSVRPLIAEHDTQTVFQFLHLLTGRIRDVRGMGHFHLPVASDNESVHILTPLFDTIVELRSNGENLQQRWRFPDEGISSSWMPL